MPVRLWKKMQIRKIASRKCNFIVDCAYCLDQIYLKWCDDKLDDVQIQFSKTLLTNSLIYCSKYTYKKRINFERNEFGQDQFWCSER